MLSALLVAVAAPTPFLSQQIGLSNLACSPFWADNGAFVLLGSDTFGHVATFRFDPEKKTIEPFITPTAYDYDQVDGDAGLYAASRGYAAHVYDVATGKDIAQIPESSLAWKRVGGIIEARKQEKGWTLYDAHTGKTLAQTPYEIVWDTPRRRLGVERHYESAPGKSDEVYAYRLIEFKPGTFEQTRTVPVGRVERDFGGFACDPDEGPLVIDFSYVGVGVESFYYEIVDSQFKLSPFTVNQFWGVSGNYILYSKDNGYPPPGNKDRYQDLSCSTLDGSKTLWHYKFKRGEFERASWRGKDVLVSKKDAAVLLDPATGKRIGTVEKSVPVTGYVHGKWRFVFDPRTRMATVYKSE